MCRLDWQPLGLNHRADVLIPGLQGGQAPGGKAGGPGDESQKAALVGRVKLADNLQEVADYSALQRVPT